MNEGAHTHKINSVSNKTRDQRDRGHRRTRRSRHLRSAAASASVWVTDGAPTRGAAQTQRSSRKRQCEKRSASPSAATHPLPQAPLTRQDVPRKQAARLGRCARTALGLRGPWPTLTVHGPRLGGQPQRAGTQNRNRWGRGEPRPGELRMSASCPRRSSSRRSSATRWRRR